VNRLIGVPLAAGLLSALLFLSLAEGFTAGVLLSYIAPLPLMMAGLGYGVAAAVAASLLGAAAVAAVAGGVSSLPFAVAVVLPGLVVVRQALLSRVTADGSVEWYPPGLILGWLAGVGAVLIVVGAALVPEHPDGVQGWVAEIIGRTLDVLAPSLPAEQRRVSAEWWTPLFPAMVAGSWLLMAAVNAVSAQALLTRLGRNRRPDPAYGQLKLPGWLGAGLLAAGVAGALAGGDLGFLARNVAALMLVPFAFLGLTDIHHWVAGRPNARMLLAVFYGVLFLAFGWAMLAVAGLGLMRFVTRFRHTRDSGGGKED
jgi:hypothetical protein